MEPNNPLYDKISGAFMRLAPRCIGTGLRLLPPALLAIGWLLGGTSCKRDPYPDTSMNNELVILAEITAGDQLKIPISKSIQVGAGGIISFEKVKSAVVTLTRGDGRSWNIPLNTSPDYAADPASVYTSTQRPKYGTRYDIKVQDPQSGTATATTVIPAHVILSHFDTSSGQRQGMPVLNCQFSLSNPPDSSCYFVFEALKQLVRIRRTFNWQGKLYDLSKPDGKALYDQVKDQVKLLRDTIATNSYKRLSLYTTDNNVDNAQLGNMDSALRRVFLQGKIFFGRPYPVSLAIDKKYFTATNDSDIGIVLLQIKSVTIELYNYWFWYEKYKADISSVPPNQLYSPPGNVQNGLGIFGGSAKIEQRFYFDDLH